MSDQLAAIARQRGKVVALFVIVGAVVAWRHESAAAAIFAAMAVPVGALAGVEAWASKGSE